MPFDINSPFEEDDTLPQFDPNSQFIEEPEEEVGTIQGIANSAQNAFDSSRQALLAVGGVDKDQAEQISKLEYAKQARKVAPDYAEYQKAEGWDAVGAFLKNPVEVTTNIIGEGLAGSLPALGAGVAAGAAGAAVGSVVPGIGTGIGYTAGQVAGTFGGSLSTEYGSKILEELQNSGMDITDPNSIQSYFSDEEKLAPIREKALTRGVPVAAFDAVSAGIGGKLGRVFGSEIVKEGEKVIGKKFATKTGEALTELGAQAVLGGGGSVAGSVAAGEEVDLKDVFAEVIGEVGPGAAEVIQGRIADRANQRKLTEAKANQNILNLSETLEQNNAPLTAQATTQELAKQLADDLNVDREKEAVELADLGGQTLKKINEVKAETQTATTKEEVAANLSDEDLNTREQDARKLVQQYKDAFFESQDPNDRAKAVEFQGVLDAIKAEKQKRKAAPAEAAAPAEPQAVKPLPTDYLPTETPGATYGRESEIYDAFANIPRKTTEATTLPVEQAPLTQQAVAQSIEKSVAQPIEKQPYATQEIIQPESVRQEPQDGTQAQSTTETIVSDSVLGPATSQEKGQITPVVSDLQSVASNTATPEQITKLSQSGLVDIVKGQPVINEDGQAALTQAQAPLPKLTPEERRAEIEVPAVTPAPVAETPAVTEAPIPVAEPTVKISRSEDFSMTGDYNVSIGDKKHRIYRDAENGYWYDADVRDNAVRNNDPAQGSPSLGLLTTETKKDAIAELVNKYKKEQQASISKTPAVTEPTPAVSETITPAAPTEFGFVKDIDADRENIKKNLIRFASGMSGLSDMRRGSYARAGHKNYGIGFDVGLLSKNTISELANFIVNLDTQVFIDSGAFSNFKKSIKEQSQGRTVEALDFDKILSKYDSIIDEISKVNVIEKTDYPKPMLVMPDVIGNQKASLDLINKHKNWIATSIAMDLSVPIIPIPLGELSLSDAYSNIIEILKSNTLGIDIDPTRFVVGIPSNAEAISRENLATFLKESKPPRIHFLGAAADRNISPLIDIVSQNSPETQVTADASKVRSAILNGVSKGKTREKAIFDALYQEDDPNVILESIKEDPTQLNPTQEQVAPAAPTGPQVGQRVRSGSTPQPFVITEVTPQTARDVELGEQYYKIKNERTGEESVVESVDITPIKTTRSSKKLKAVYPSKGGVEVGDMNIPQIIDDTITKITPKTPEEETVFQKALSNKMMARNPELAIAAVRLKNGEITAKEYADLIDIIDPFTIKGSESIPTKSKIDQYIDEGKKNKVNAPIENGKEVEFRIDIPTYNRSTAAGNTVYAVTAHEPVPETSKRVGIPISYVGVAKVINPKMMTRSISGKGEAIDIATGSGKFPLATVKGNYESITELPSDINDPNVWTEVSYNPIRSSYFVDVRSKNAVVGGEEAIMVGSRVFVKNPQMQDRPTGVVGGNGVTDIRYSRARDKAKYREEYKSLAIQEKVQNYIKIAQDEMQEAIDNGDTNLAKDIQESIDTAKGYNINESELYSEKELENGVRNFFKGSIPNNVIFTNDIGSESYASYNLENGEIEINRAYFKSNVNIDAIIGHELGHFAFGDPEFQKILTSFWDGLTQEQRDAISKYVEENYSSFNADLKNEEKVIQAWQSLLEENPEIRSAWKNFVELVKRFFNKYFSTKFEVNDSDKFVLNVLNSIRQEFINGRKIVREDGSNFKLQAKAQVHGQKEAGRELESFVGGEKIVQDIVRQNYFDSTQFNSENTQKAYDLLQLLTDFTDRKNDDFATKLNEDIQSKLKDKDVHPDIKQVIGVQILRNELQRYSNKLMQNGDFLFEKKYKLNANHIPLGIKDVNTSNIARALSAIARINNPMLGAFEAQTKGEVVQLASTTFGTKEPSTEQINAIEEALRESSRAETIDNADILDSVVSAESKTGMNIRKDIDATIKKSGVKQKTVDDVIGSTETGKNEFTGVDASTAKASIKKQATSPVDAQAERAIEGLAKLQSDVQDWPNKTQNQVRSIVQQDLRQRPDMGRKDAWKSLLASKLMNAGASESNAMTLSDLVWRQHEINNMNREIKLIESAAENGSLGVIVEMIKNTPLQEQATPEWRKKVIRQYLMSAGLSEKQAESAARLYDNIIAEKIAEAKQKAFEQSISKTSPWKDHMSRNGQLAKDALKKVLNAVRTSALDPTQNTESIIAKQNGWTGFSESDFRRIAEIDEILNDPKTDDLKKSEVMKELNDIISKTKLPVTVKQALAAYYTGQALMGVPTVTVNIFSPLGFSLRNLFTDIARFGLTDPTRIPLAFDTFLESMRSWYNQTKYAFKNEVYPNDVVEYLNGNNVLKELYNKGKNEWKKGNYATGLRDMLIGSTQITGRVLSALDQGAISALENQAVSRYAIEAMSLTNIPRSQRNVAAQKILEAKRNTYASLIASGMEKDRAGVLSDMEMKKEVLYQLSSLGINPEKIQEVIDSSINDALLSVGRNRTISMDGLSNEQKRLSDSGMLSYLPIKFLEQMASNAAQQGPLMQIFSKMLYGFALVPARTFHNAAWYSPYGFLRIFRDKYQKSKGMESSYGLSLGNELQYRQRLTESIAGSVAMIGLAALAASSTDDDDDRKLKIVVTGNGPDAAADKQYYDSWIKKWKPNSVHIVMGDTVIPINIGRGGEAVFFPIMLAGALDDWNIRNKMNKAKKKPADLNQATVMLGSAFLALAQRGPYAAFGKPLFNATRAGQLPEELAAQAGYFGKTFVPVLGTSLARNISDLINDPIDKSSMSGAMYSNIPIVGPMIGTKALNALGQPIRADDWGDRLYKLGVPMVFSFPKNSPENTLNELILSKGDGPAIPTRRNVESKMERPLTNEEFYAYVKTYGDSVSKSMFRHRNSLARMDSSRYQSELEDYSKAANERAARTVKRMSMK